MSEQTPEAVELPASLDGAFSALMDALAPEEAGAEAPAAGATDARQPGGAGDAATEQPGAGDAAAGGAGASDAPAQPATGATAGEAGDGAGAGVDATGTGEPADGGAEQPAAVGGDADRPAGWTVKASDVVGEFGKLTTAFEESTSKAYQNEALTEVRTEYAGYFAALEQHPRLLVGTKVPRVGGEGEETLQSTTDAREWQEAVKSVLVAEVNDRAGRLMENASDFMNTVHASIELFVKNPDLVPGTVDFDRQLADEFATLAKPYELRVDGKLQGYTIPVQPIIEQLRTKLHSQRKAASPPADAAPAAPAKKAADPPQAGIVSKAGNSGEVEDFSTLFGTIGLPNLRI